jgi:hypothetical protein
MSQVEEIQDIRLAFNLPRLELGKRWSFDGYGIVIVDTIGV